MILKQHSDASYLSEGEARSCRHAGFFYCGDSGTANQNNGALLITSTIMHNVMSSAAEVECGSLFNKTAKRASHSEPPFEEMGHPQPATPTQVDNSTKPMGLPTKLPQTMQIQIYGHAILMDPARSRQTRPIQCLLLAPNH
jgi:hypothetical protein